MNSNPCPSQAVQAAFLRGFLKPLFLVVLAGTVLVPGAVLRVPGALAAETNATALFQEASRLQNQGKFADALVKWRQFLASYEDDPAAGQAYQGLGTCLLETGEYTPAIQALDQALKRLPEGEKGELIHWNRAVALFRQADQGKKPEQYQEAGTALRTIAKDKDTPKGRRDLARFYLAKSEQAQGKRDMAKELYRDLLAETPDKNLASYVILALASLAEEAKDWPEVIRLDRAFLHDYPDHGSAEEARLGLADALLQDGRRDEAEPLFGQLRKREQLASAGYALFRWGESAYLRGDYQAASERLSALLQKYPKSPNRDSALLMEGEAYVQEKHYPEATRAFEEFLKEYPGNAERDRAAVGLGQALYLAGKYAQAEESLKASLSQLKDEDLGQALLLLARCATRLNHTAEAIDRYQECFQTRAALDDPEQARYEAAGVALAAGIGDPGLAWTDDLVQRFSKSPWAGRGQFNAARWLADRGQFGPALIRCRWVLDAGMPDLKPQALYLAGFCSMKLRKFQDAAALYKDLVDHFPKFEQAPAALFSLAVAQEALGTSTKAIATYQDCLKRFPEDPLAQKAKDRLQILQTTP